MTALPGEQKIVGIVAKNSQEYIEQVFRHFSAGDIVVTLRTAEDQDRIYAAGVQEIITPAETQGWIALPELPHRPEESIAQILFTSGTEGIAKGIILQHGALSNTNQRLIDIMQITPDIKEYIGIPIYYSFGFGRVRIISEVGGKAYLPANGFSPSEIAQMLADKQINSLSAVPTLLRVLLQAQELFHDCGKNLKWLEIGSQYMSAKEKQSLKELFPNASIIQHYGLTEASRSTFLKIHEASDNELESVGHCLPGTEVRINDDNLIQIRGPHLARQMLVNGKITPLLEDGWLTTTDAGHLNDSGQLYFDGRADDVINCGGIKLAPDTLQIALNKALGVNNAICVAKIDDDMRGDNILVAYTRDSNLNPDELRKHTRHLLENQGINIGNAAELMEVESFPVTETGKLQRKRLAELFYEMHSNSSVDTQDDSSTDKDTTQTDPLTAQLISAWEETLKIKPVSQHDSFFDLGGDSLSAIRLSVRMEKLGFAKEVCQEIFRGKTIAEIASIGKDNSGSQEATQTLVTLWEDTLKIKPVSEHDSFFDLGGDSLSAIRLSVKMEKAGFSKEVCQEVFRGKTISQIADINANSHSRDLPKKTILSSASKSIDITRGILVLLVVASHWMPGVMQYMSEQINTFNKYLSPLYSAGTPGFAIIFGVGVGFFNLGRFKKHPDSIGSMVLQNIIILAFGVLALALVGFLALHARQEDITPVAISNLFWSVISYYLAAILTLPLWLRYLARFENALVAAIGLSTIFFAVHIFIDDIWKPSPSENPVLQTLILFGTAKYNYFEMSAGAMLGAALGIWYRKHIQDFNNLGTTTPIGLFLVAFSIILSHEMGNMSMWFEWPKPLALWTWTFYLGAIILCINALFYYVKRDHLNPVIEMFLNIAATLGTMAFPIFIGHELVLPLRDVLQWAGLPMALPIALTLFFVPTGYYTFKLYHLYFATRQGKSTDNALSHGI